MRAMNVLRSACMLAVACGVVATLDAVAQVRDKPASSQVRKSAPKAAQHAQRKQAGQARHGKKKVAAHKAKPRKPVATVKRQPTTTTTAARRAPQTRPLPPPVAWVPPPLGPERFYPNGIPELRPEFLHPEGPPARVEQAANTGPEPLGGQPEWLP